VGFTHRHFRYDAIHGHLADAVTEVKLPVYFFTGRHDLTDPFVNTVEYATKLQAPRKRIVWFEDSAHFPFLEEPARFCQELHRVREETEGNAGAASGDLRPNYEPRLH
jgi:pimeloyl-ACP methyl ester carboxylesterase